MKQHPIAPSRRKMSDALLFLSHWMQSPARMGSLAPSSRALARAMAAQIPAGGPDDTAPIIELGGGTGSITAGLLEAGIPAQRLMVIERDRRLARHLAHRFPDVRVVCEDAAALRSVMFRHGLPQAAAIVSGLPFLLFSEETREQIIEACFNVLGTGQPLIQFTYGLTSPLPHGLYGLAARRAGRVWRNLPPATIWTYRAESSLQPA